MTPQRLLPGFLVALCLCVVACSARKDPQVQKPSSPQVAACEIDAKAVCQQIADKPVNSAGMMLDPREREEAGRRTDWEYVPIEIPNGATLQVNCELNLQHNSVVYASITKGPTLKQSDVDYLRGHGYCRP